MLLVTGANGEIGIPFLRHLSLRGIPARAAVRSQRAEETLRASLGEKCGAVVRVDYRDPKDLARAAAGCDAIVHLVGIIKETRSARYEETHEAIARALVAGLSGAPAPRLIAASIFGADPASDNRCLASRGRSDAILLESAIPSLVLRPPMILSAGGPAARALYARASGRALWLGDGSSLEQPLDARDFVLALTTAATRSEPLAGVFDIAGPECLTQRDLVLRSASLLGTKPRPIHVPLGIARLLARAAERFTENPPITEAMLDVLLHHDRVDIAPASRALDLAPRPLDETLRHVLRAHASQL